MNGLQARSRTLGELLTELRGRLGFATQGSAAKNNEATLKSYLQEAHDFVYAELDPPAMRKKSIVTALADSYLYDWHDDAADEDIDPANVISVWVKVSGTIREPMTYGISERDRSFESQRQQPTKYDTLNGQLEIWPVPERTYELIIEHTAVKGRFTQAGDRSSVPDRLVFLYALTNAKAHYRQPDAQAPAQAFQTLLSRTKTKQKEGRRYFVNTGSTERESQVVRSGDGYVLRG